MRFAISEPWYGFYLLIACPKIGLKCYICSSKLIQEHAQELKGQQGRKIRNKFGKHMCRFYCCIDLVRDPYSLANSSLEVKQILFSAPDPFPLKAAEVSPTVCIYSVLL